MRYYRHLSVVPAFQTQLADSQTRLSCVIMKADNIHKYKPMPVVENAVSISLFAMDQTDIDLQIFFDQNDPTLNPQFTHLATRYNKLNSEALTEHVRAVVGFASECFMGRS